MALSDNRRQRIGMLCAMYVAQGIPWGFMVTSVASYLAQHGVSLSDIGNLTAVVLFPWTFKLVWAPIMDSITIRSMGRRRPWIIAAELMMAVSLLLLMTVEEPATNLVALTVMFFTHNVFASLQDVCTDALAVDVLSPEEQGQVNGLMWGSKLVGKGAGGALLAVVISVWGFQASIIVQFVILLGIMIFPIMMVERPGEKRMPWSAGQAADLDSTQNLRAPTKVIGDLLKGFSIITTSAYVMYGLVHVAGWGIVEVVTKYVYMKRLEWTFVEFSVVEGWSILPQMFGAVGGGWLCDRIGRKTIMFIGFGGYGLMAIIFGAFPQMWEQEWFAKAYLICNPGVLALGSVGFLSMGMKISWTKSAATMFTIFMTVSNIGHVIGNKVVGPLETVLKLSHEQIFIAAGVTMLVPLLFLLFVRPAQVDEARRREQAETADADGTQFDSSE